MNDKFRDECGVFGIFCDNPENVAPLVYRGLFALQHRGQESAGMAVVNDGKINVHKAAGLVSNVFSPELISQLKGSAALGHVRYSTESANGAENIEPFVTHIKNDFIALAHNGALTNYDAVRELLEDSGMGFSSSNDGEVIVNLLARNYKKGLENTLADTIQIIKGSYAFLLLTKDALIGARDPNGIRPLCLGKLPGKLPGKMPSLPGGGGGWVLSSESCGIEAAGGTYVRDVEPGEVVMISKGQMRSFNFSEKKPKAVCSFEYVYFARPDSVIDGVDVYQARIRAGEILGKEAAVSADLVIGVPDSGIPAAIGYGRATGTTFGTGILKNRYVGRTFIVPGQTVREEKVFFKHFVIRSEVRGKRIVLIDDSIVRGTTSRRLISILKESGAKEVHIRVCSPPVRFPCYFGIDTPYREDLISNVASKDELCKFLGADSLAFISVEGLMSTFCPANKDATVGDAAADAGFCLACFTGEYPVPVEQIYKEGEEKWQK